jgi:glutathione synthase
MRALADLARPKLVADGMFLVGLDIVGDKLMEINVFSPGGLGSCRSLYDVDFAPAVIEALETKMMIRRHYPDSLPNATLATV